MKTKTLPFARCINPACPAMPQSKTGQRVLCDACWERLTAQIIWGEAAEEIAEKIADPYHPESRTAFCTGEKGAAERFVRRVASDALWVSAGLLLGLTVMLAPGRMLGW